MQTSGSSNLIIYKTSCSEFLGSILQYSITVGSGEIIHGLTCLLPGTSSWRKVTLLTTARGQPSASTCMEIRTGAHLYYSLTLKRWCYRSGAGSGRLWSGSSGIYIRMGGFSCLKTLSSPVLFNINPSFTGLHGSISLGVNVLQSTYKEHDWFKSLKSKKMLVKPKKVVQILAHTVLERCGPSFDVPLDPDAGFPLPLQKAPPEGRNNRAK